METLEQQIAKLTAEHNFKSEMETLLGGYKFNSAYHPYKNRDFLLWIDLLNWPAEMDISSQLYNIISILKPTEETQEYDHKTKVTSYSPFSLQFKSEVRSNYAQISYISNKIQVEIKVPISFYKDIYRESFRGVNDTEHVHFLGESRAEINRYKIRVYSSNYYENLAWYGGNYTTYIVDPEYREGFERMVLTGKEPLE